MKSYECSVISLSGEKKTIERQANSADEVARLLEAEGFFCEKIKDLSSDGKKTRKKYGFATVLEFTETLYMFVASGISINQSFELMKTLFKKSKTGGLVDDILEKIRRGDTFHSAIEANGSSFSPVYRGLISISEKTGQYERVFERLVFFMKKEKKLKEQLVSSMIYPLFVMTFAIIGVTLLSFFVFPKLVDGMVGFSGEVPASLQKSIRFMDNLKISLVFVIVFVILLSIFISLKKVSSKIKRFMDALLLKIPLIKSYLINKECLSFCFAMESLTSCGVSVEDAMEDSLEVFTNLVFRDAIEKALGDVRKGSGLHESFADSKIIPDIMTKWLYIGEKTGQVESTFLQLRNYFSDKVDKVLSRVVSLAEPVLIMLTGMFVLLIAVKIVLPLFSMYR
ncbi:MAG: type II secretion system F family protein [Spirochaetales bacterium]|nr:type II secretion system F family protein [Spirochaetales bacterium]